MHVSLFLKILTLGMKRKFAILSWRNFLKILAPIDSVTPKTVVYQFSWKTYSWFSSKKLYWGAGVRTSDVQAHAYCGVCELTRISLNVAGSNPSPSIKFFYSKTKNMFFTKIGTLPFLRSLNRLAQNFFLNSFRIK